MAAATHGKLVPARASAMVLAATLALTCCGCGPGAGVVADAAAAGDTAATVDAAGHGDGPAATDTSPHDAAAVDASPLDASVDAAPADALPPCGVAPTLASLEATYFADSCTFSSCHGAKKQGGLSLLPGKAWASLVNVAAQHPAAVGRMRVVPGNPKASFLVTKVRGPKPAEGDLMPPGEVVPFDEACGIAALEAWILAGAKPD